jgi:hypothetical protein
MKIGILTLPLGYNYGGILQVYALQTVLERMGHEVVMIEKIKKYNLPLWKKPFSYTKRFILKYVLGKQIRIFTEKYEEFSFPIITQYTQTFINKHIHVYKTKRLEDINEDTFDAIVVGSDQVWRPKYSYRPIENAYLKFTMGWNIKRIAYAASFGTDEWEYTPNATANCSKLLKMFNAVSVREQSAVNLCMEHFNVKATHVIDPTFLLSTSDYISLIDGAQMPRSNGIMLVYILDDAPIKTQIVNMIAKKRHLKPFIVNAMPENRFVPIQKRIQPPVEQWLQGFNDAEYVVTDSFHGCAFSINFNKPFVVFGNKGRGMSRFSSLLAIFGLTDRLVTNVEEAEDVLKNDIDWTDVNRRLVIQKTEAETYLQSTIFE